jgi:hypothetical protein
MDPLKKDGKAVAAAEADEEDKNDGTGIAFDKLDVTRRYGDGKCYTFIVNMTAEQQNIELDIDGTELLSDTGYSAGDKLTLDPKDVMIIESMC